MAKITTICPHCHKLVPPNTRCSCTPPRRYTDEATRRAREPHRSEYRTAAYQRDRQAVLERQAGRCAGCGTTIAVRQQGRWRTLPGAGVHHVTKLRDGGGDLLVGLCRRCHHRADAQGG